MEEIIELQNIQIHQNAQDWQQAIRVAGNPLVEKGSIQKEYLENMVQSVLDMGPYIVMMPYFALAHAAPCPEVIKDDMSVAVFDNEIHFGSDNDPVRVIMCLACTDGVSHIQKLSKIAEKLIDCEADLIGHLMNAESVQEIYNLLNS